MYEGGARLFVEVGPKRALALFAEQIFEDKPKLVANTNHPKVGGIASFHAALAVHALSGRSPQMPGFDSDVLTESFKAGVRISTPTVAPTSGTTRPTSTAPPQTTPHSSLSEEELEEIDRKLKESAIAKIVSGVSGFPMRMIHGSTDLETIGLSQEKISEIHHKIQSNFQVKGSTDASTLPALIDWLDVTFQPDSLDYSENSATHTVERQPDPMASRRSNPFVFSGISLGLPGMEEVFAPDSLDRIIRGDNFISELPDEIKQRLLERNLVRIIKHADGSAEFVPCDDFSLIPQLAGRKGHFDLAEQYGVDSKIVEAMDITTSLALAAGLEALKDAGLPLLPVEQINKAGKRHIQHWHLPESERDCTGVLFASCFPGIEQAMLHAQNNGAD